jgi:hypothetical protein
VDCIRLEVRDPATSSLLTESRLPTVAARTVYEIAIYQASLPTTVALQAFGSNGTGCVGSPTPTAASATADGTFQIGQTIIVDLTLQPGAGPDGGADAGPSIDASTADAAADASSADAGGTDAGIDAGAAVDAGVDSGVAADASSGLDAGVDAGAIVLVQDVIVHTNSQTGSVAATFPSVSAAGDVVVATISNAQASSISSVAGLAITTWVQAVANQTANGQSTAWIYLGVVTSPSVSAVTVMGGSDNWTLELSEWSGLVGNVDGTATQNTGTVRSGNVAIGRAPDLLIALEIDDQQTISAPTNSFIALKSNDVDVSHNPAYLVAATAGTYATTWPARGNWVGMIAAFH